MALPEKVRTAGDLPALNRPWIVALAMGLLQIQGSTVATGPALATWPPADSVVLDAWLAGFGASWLHDIALQKKLPREPGTTYPFCVKYSGDSPVEYQDDDEEQQPEPFDLEGVNRRLATLRE